MNACLYKYGDVVCSPSRDRTWPLARTRRGKAGPGGGLENGGNTRSRMHGKYSYGLSLDGRVIDIITRRTRMRRHRLSSSSRFPPVVAESLLSSRLSFRTSHGAPYIYVYIYTRIYITPPTLPTFLFIGFVGKSPGRPPPSASRTSVLLPFSSPSRCPPLFLLSFSAPSVVTFLHPNPGFTRAPSSPLPCFLSPYFSTSCILYSSPFFRHSVSFFCESTGEFRIIPEHPRTPRKCILLRGS